ncbi:unnamed protein product [Heligmosomoides polygyrus]|uniref:MFS domain-containing protein n=1 Tax=Heligmosomoides polygyrus TaxID=6339 RepID=A0A3P8AET6_HELPZ|nr:unnamed protein product [Heligmosomoides polygyrus]
MHLAITMTCMVNSTAVSIMEDKIFHPEHTNITLEVIMDADEANFTLPDSRCQRQADDGHPIVVDYGPTCNTLFQGTLFWSHQTQNIIFSATFWGALLVIGPSMLIWHCCSPRLLLFAALLVYVASTSVTPWLALRLGPIAVFAARLFMGFGEGFVIPSVNALIANWFPVEEKSTALALYTAGNQLAGALGNPMAAAFCASSFGWPGVFYSIATIGTLWCVLWFFTSTDHPKNCKRISDKEYAYLTNNIMHSHNRAATASSVPYARIFTSSPFLAQLLCFYITNLTITLFHFYVPSFLKDILYLGVIANGTFSSLPNVVNLVVKIIWSLLMDRLKAKKVITPTFAGKEQFTDRDESMLHMVIVRHFCLILASFGSAVAFFLVALLVDCTTPVLALVLFCVMYGAMGGFSSGFYTSLLSLAPRYTSTMSAISLFVGMLGRLSAPPLVQFVKKTGTLGEWRILFCIVGACNVVAGTVFLFFGSGDVQEWGRDDEHVNENSSEKLDEITLIEGKRAESLRV